MSVAVPAPRIEYLRRTCGLGARAPRVSWRTVTDRPGWRQAAYAIRVADGDGTPVCDTGRVDGDAQLLVAWPAPPLTSRERRSVQVRVWGTDGSMSDWSPATEIEAGLLDEADWSSRFITAPWTDTGQDRPATLFRRDFELAGAPLRARLYATALGVYTAHLNGQPVSDDVLAPGWTSYSHRVYYQTVDVTQLLRPGDNTIVLTVADGWYRGNLAGHRDVYGERTAALAQLEVTLVDGSVHTVATDPAWTVGTGPIRSADLYDGETYDARIAPTRWVHAELLEPAGRPTLVAQTTPPVRRIEHRGICDVVTTPGGATVLDFGQNLVGRLRLTAAGPAGTEIALRHAEVLEHGELCTRILRGAKATDRYIVRGDPKETWEPEFTFHGFRYAQVDGWPGALTRSDVEAVVVHSDLERTGFFECSDPLVNRLHDNVVWSMRGNFLAVPTDCPQRDERLGWTGDIQVFAPTAAFLYDVTGFLSSWLDDLALDQAADGCVPLTVPTRPDSRLLPAAGWGDAAVLVPWALYRASGDAEVLARQFPSMRRWVDLLQTRLDGARLWRGDFQFGDWLDPTAPNDKPNQSLTDPDLVATAYVYRSARVLADIAGVLGEPDAAARYSALAADVRTAFDREYVTTSGRLRCDTQTAHALAIAFGLIEGAERRARAGERLAELVRAASYTLTTGFLGTPVICDALTDTGHVEDAYRLLQSSRSPSWLAPLALGATTMWERWDAMLPDGSANGETMTSFNHYALGAVADWLHRVVGGIRPLTPGYRRVLIAPQPGGTLTWARTRLATAYGPVECEWRRDDEQLSLSVDVPPNCTAVVQPPGRPAVEVGAGRQHFDCKAARVSCR